MLINVQTLQTKQNKRFEQNITIDYFLTLTFT